MSSPCEKLIRRDIARTYPEHEFFKGQDSLGQEVLFNVMKVRGRKSRNNMKCNNEMHLLKQIQIVLYKIYCNAMQKYIKT